MASLARRPGLDALRGLALVSMMAYHAAWDLVYLYGADWPWYHSTGAFVWQQSICWTFILLSGYCFSLGRHQLRRGWMTFGGGAVVTAVTWAMMPEQPALFGVLTFLGSAALLTVPLDRLLKKIPAPAGLAGSFALFGLFRWVNRGTLGLLALPEGWYANLFTAFLGFPPAGFRSSDYFSLLPWLFLFWTGYYLYRLHPAPFLRAVPRVPVLNWLGRHSLLVYLLHQPVIYGALALWHLIF